MLRADATVTGLFSGTELADEHACDMSFKSLFSRTKKCRMINAFPQNSVAQNFRHESRAQTWRCDVLEKQLDLRLLREVASGNAA